MLLDELTDFVHISLMHIYIYIYMHQGNIYEILQIPVFSCSCCESTFSFFQLSILFCQQTANHNNFFIITIGHFLTFHSLH